MTEYVNSIIKLDTVKHSPSYGSVLPVGDGRLLWVWGSGRADPIEPVQANYSEDEGGNLERSGGSDARIGAGR